jgi:putative membrane protein insertion efficiency factor
VRTSPGQRAALWLIHTYQGLRHGKPSPCRFYPSCSSYAEEALTQHGLWRGGRLALGRLLRCHPFGGRGVDLVPLPAHDPKGAT